MGEYYALIPKSDTLEHHGVKGMKWGVRKTIDYVAVKKASRRVKNVQKNNVKQAKAAYKMGLIDKKSLKEAKQKYKTNLKKIRNIEKESIKKIDPKKSKHIDSPNSKYSYDQRIRDKKVYGSGGVKRINRNMNTDLNDNLKPTQSIQAARSREASRIYGARRRSVVTGQLGSIVGGVAGAAAGYFIGKKVLSNMNLDETTNMMAKGAISIGASSIGATLGRYGGQSIGMLSGGYSPRKFRYN